MIDFAKLVCLSSSSDCVHVEVIHGGYFRIVNLLGLVKSVNQIWLTVELFVKTTKKNDPIFISPIIN